ncbi:MAG TPA: hypothetical protein VFS67_09140 [Polyangiaceae bacterium]|nr:hypothetical protein [Polyangiaceae bacterium]
MATGGSGGGDPGSGDPGPVECQVNDECRGRALAELESLAPPRSERFEISSSSCQASGVILEDRQVSGNACMCNFASGSGRMLGPAGIGCNVTGRAGDCLWTDAEFSGCSITDAHACDAPCADLAQRLTADAARTLQTELVYAGCEQGRCQNVVSIDNQCYANRSYQQGKSYDCALGAQGVLQAAAIASQPPERQELPNNGNSPYQPGTNGNVQLTVQHDYWGTAPGPLGFGVFAQFFDVEGADVRYGDVLDPLDGIDDCGVVRESPIGGGASIQLRSVDRAVLRDGDRDLPLEEFRSSSDTFFSYILDLTGTGPQPRFNGRYGFSASGGSFGASIELDNITLPEDLTVTELQARSHFPRAPLALTWTGTSANALQLSLYITPGIDNYNGAYQIDCLMTDDGAFTIPEAVMAAAPDGFVTATLRRARRTSQRSGGKVIQSIAEVIANHRFVLGPNCDGSELVAACQRSANTIRARYQECSEVEPPPLEQLCPDYLATTCGACPEYFDCLATTTTCESAGLTMRAGCSCR